MVAGNHSTEQEMEEGKERRLRPPWRRTVAAQVVLCLALYGAFSLGERQLQQPAGAAAAMGRCEGDVCFLSVADGARPPALQARLLKQMENVAKVYQVKFVLDVAQFGEDDPLWQNGSLYFQVLKIPWFSTTSQGQIVGNFVKKIKMPYEQVLEIIGVDMGPLQEPLHDGRISTIFREQMEWLEQSLAVTSSNWKIVVGYNQLVICDEAHREERTKWYEPLQRIFAKYAVNAYLSTTGSCGCFYHDNSMLYIGNPSPGDQTNADGFLLHRVSPLEIELLLMNLEGKVVSRSVVHQYGRGAM